MSYTNLNNPANYQLQSFGQDGMRTISTTQAYVEGEYYRVLVATEDSTLSATSVIGDNLSSIDVYAGTTIYGLFTAVEVTAGEVTAYLAGRTDIEDVWAYIEAYGLSNGATIEGEQCAKDAISPLLDKYYAQASLVLVPSLYKTSVVYAERPLDSNGQLTFTRASDASRVNADGLIEKVRTNVALYSEAFDNADWNKIACSITANYSTAPNGTTTADLFDSGTGSANHIVEKNRITGAVGITLSIYAKYVDAQYFLLGTYDSAYRVAAFDIQNGTIGNYTAGLVPSIENVGGGWFRCSVTNANNTRVDPYFTFSVRNDNTASFNFTGSNFKALVWGAMQEVSDFGATPYIPTTTAAVSVGPVSNVPRLDYSGGCPSLLLEPQRTNLVTYSEQFDNAAWTKTATNVTANAAISPDGYVNADKIISNATNAFHDIRSAANITLAAGNATVSLFAKADGYNFIELGVSSSSLFAKYATIVVDLSTGTNANTGVNLTWTIVSSKIENYGSGWYRVSLTFNVDASTSSAMVFMTSLPTSTRGVTFLGDGTSGTLFYGAQLESAASYLSSYIPTLGSAVTRLADSLRTASGATSLFNSTWTAFGELIIQAQGNGGTATGYGLRSYYGATGSSSWVFNVTHSLTTAGAVDFIWIIGGSNTNVKTVSITYGTPLKFAATSDGSLYVNGVQISASASLTPVTPVELAFGRLAQADASNGEAERVAQALLFKSILTPAQLAELTAL